MIHHKVAEHTTLYLNLLMVGLPLDFVAGLEFGTGHHTHAFEHPYGSLVKITVEDNGAAGLAVESAGCGFSLPLLAVTVAVETDGTAGLDVLAEHMEDSRNLFHTIGHQRIHTVGKRCEGLCHSGIEHNHGAGAVGHGTYGTELETVSGESER